MTKTIMCDRLVRVCETITDHLHGSLEGDIPFSELLHNEGVEFLDAKGDCYLIHDMIDGEIFWMTQVGGMEVVTSLKLSDIPV